MEASARSYAWEGKRMPHQRSSADGQPSSSGRPEARRSGSGDLQLRSLARLPRASQNGSEPLALQQPAEDALLQSGEEQAARRTIDLKARPPNTAQRSNSTSTGRRVRRGSIADFLGFKSGSPSQESSAAPSRDVTLHGMAMPSAPGARSRRSSFLGTFGNNTAQQTEVDNNGESGAGAAPLSDAMSGPVDLAKSLPASSQGRWRRASMLDLFRSMHSVETSGECGEPGQQGEPLPRTKSTPKQRRASVIDFFRSSNTGMANVDDPGTPGNAQMGRRLPRGDSRGQRRRSVIDILGHSSKKVFAKLMHHEFDHPLDEDDLGVEGKLWFTSLNDFKPLTFQYLSGRYSSAFFACSVKTGQHYILKKFDKGKMNLSDERGVRRALHFAEVLNHEHIVQCCGLWEDEQALYIVEEYAVKGDLLQDSLSHPEKYSEAFMATKVVKPLLDVLAYLHAANVVHRAIFPEYVMFGREDKLKLGHFTSAIDQRMDPPTERIPFLDYMAPEMLSVRSEDCGGGGLPYVVAAAAGPAAAGTGRGKAPGTPVFDFGNGHDSFLTSPKQQQQLLQQQQQQQQQQLQQYNHNQENHPYQQYQPPTVQLPPPPQQQQYQQQQNQQQQLANMASLTPSRRQTTSSGAQLLEFFGLSPHSPVNKTGADAAGGAALDKCPLSPVSRSSTRSNLNLFRSARRLTPAGQLQQQQQVLQPMISSDDDRSGMSYGSGMPSAAPPPAMMMPQRRRKSALEEMNAPWLRPIGSDSQSTCTAETRDGADALWEPADGGGGGGGSDTTDHGPVTTPVVETTSAGPTADGSGGDAVANAVSGDGSSSSVGVGVGSSMPAAGQGGNDGGGVGNPRSQSQLARADSVQQNVVITAAAAAAAAQLDEGQGDHSPVERLRPSPPGSSTQLDQAPSSPSPPPASQPPSHHHLHHHHHQHPHLHQQQQYQQQQQQYRQQGVLTDGTATAAADDNSPPLRPAPSWPQPPRPPSACRSPGSSSVHRSEPSPAFRSGSGALCSGGGSGGGKSSSGTPLSPPLPRPGPGLTPGPLAAANSRLPPFALGSGGSGENGRLADRDECLPGYAAEPLAHRCSTSLQGRPPPPPPPLTGLHRLQAADSAAAPSSPPPSPPFPPSPGPVVESLIATEHTPMMPYDGGVGSPPDATEVKPSRAVVSFTTAAGDCSSPTGVDAYGDDARPSGRSSRLVSQEPSSSFSQGAQMMAGLRTIAKNITTRLGMVLGGRGDLLSPGAASQGDTSGWGDVADAGAGGGGGGGGGGPREMSPRPSCPGAGEATALIMPNNPWEWQDHYNEKVDLWQVGCLVHEILCFSLPFETEDKLLASALILWADIVSFPDHLSPECHDFMRACLTKNPVERPSAAELLQHPWIVRHAAGEVLKSVREHRENETLAAFSSAQQLTLLQRAAAAIGLGWVVGAGGGAASSHPSSSSSSSSSPRAASPWGRWFWLLRRWNWNWSSKVAPSGEDEGGEKDEGEAKLAMAMAMVQEQHQQQHQQQLGAGTGCAAERGSRRKSADVEAARRSLEWIRQHQHHR